MSRTTLVFILFVVIVAAIIGLSQFIRSQPPLEISIAVDPLAEDWAQAVVDDFNAADIRVNNGANQVNVTLSVEDDLDIWQGRTGWNLTDHPDGWLAASSVSVDYIPANLRFETVVNSTARTPLVWGGFADRVAVLEDEFGSFDWDAVSQAAAAERWSNIGGESNWNFFQLAFNRPGSSMSGVAVLLSGAADFADTDTITRQIISGSEFSSWLDSIINSVPNFQTLGNDPAAALASRGAVLMDIALLPEKQWLTNIDRLADLSAPLVFSYPQYQFVLDFPVAAWRDENTEPHIIEAVQAFGEYLLTDSAQSKAIAAGLRPVDGEPSGDAPLFVTGQAYGILLEPEYGVNVQPPGRSDLESLIRRLG